MNECCRSPARCVSCVRLAERSARSASSTPVAGPLLLRVEPLPAATLGEVIGVLEMVKQNGGAMDVFELDEVTDYDFGRTLSVIKAGEMLQLLDTPGNKVLLTAIGQALLVADTNTRKETLHRQLTLLHTFQFIKRLLGNFEQKRLPKDVVVEQLAIHLPSAELTQLFDTIVDWARYAELLGYEPETAMLYLDAEPRKET